MKGKVAAEVFSVASVISFKFKSVVFLLESTATMY